MVGRSRAAETAPRPTGIPPHRTAPSPPLDPRASRQRSRELAEALAREADRLKGEAIRVLDVQELIYITDFFVIVTSQSARQTKALAAALRARAKELTGSRGQGEGTPRSSWMLCDFDTVVAHVLTPEAREFYDLDALWADAEEVEVEFAA